MLQGLKSDKEAADRAGEKLKQAEVLMKEEHKTIVEYYKERQRLCYEPLKANIEARSGDIPKGCKFTNRFLSRFSFIVLPYAVNGVRIAMPSPHSGVLPYPLALPIAPQRPASLALACAACRLH